MRTRLRQYRKIRKIYDRKIKKAWKDGEYLDNFCKLQAKVQSNVYYHLSQKKGKCVWWK